MVADTSANIANPNKITRNDFKDAFIDWRVWGIMLSNMLASLSSQGFTIFFPVVVKVSSVLSDIVLLRLSFLYRVFSAIQMEPVPT